MRSWKYLACTAAAIGSCRAAGVFFAETVFGVIRIVRCSMVMGMGDVGTTRPISIKMT